jgi:hypothetical protein
MGLIQIMEMASGEYDAKKKQTRTPHHRSKAAATPTPESTPAVVPVQTPPVETPPVETPPAETPPAETPPSTT